MPLKNGQLNATELRRMIKKHNELMSIKIPKGTNRAGLLKLITDNGYNVNHTAQKLEPAVKMKRKPTVKLPPAPAKKTAEEKTEAKKKKSAKAVEVETAGYESRKKKIDAVQKLRKKKVPKGSHEMPDGSIMKDEDMPDKKPLQIGDKKGEEPVKKRNLMKDLKISDQPNYKRKDLILNFVKLYKIRPSAVLGVPENPTQEELKIAYRKKIRTLHPDKVGESKKEESRRFIGAYNLFNSTYEVEPDEDPKGETERDKEWIKINKIPEGQLRVDKKLISAKTFIDDMKSKGANSSQIKMIKSYIGGYIGLSVLQSDGKITISSVENQRGRQIEIFGVKNVPKQRSIYIKK